MKPASVVISAAMLIVVAEVPVVGGVFARDELSTESYPGQNFLYRGYCGESRLHIAYRFTEGLLAPQLRAGAAS